MGKIQEDLVSIIMSVYNEKKEWLVDCIESLIHQTYRNIEVIIIVDNPKNSEVIEVIKKYQMKDGRIRYFINKENIGLVRSLNLALNYCNGKYIARMDADDISLSNRIEYQVNYLLEHNIDLCASYFIRIDENNKELNRFNSNFIKHEHLRQAQQYTNLLAHPTWVFKRSILLELMEYHDIPTAEDYDFTCRLILAGYKIGIVPEYLLKYRVRKNSITNSNILYQKIIFNRLRTSFRNSIRYKKSYTPKRSINRIKINDRSKKNYIIAIREYSEFKNCIKARRVIIGLTHLTCSIIKSPIAYKLILKDKIYAIQIKKISLTDCNIKCDK